MASVVGIDEVLVQDKPKHSKNAALGLKKVVYSDTIILEQNDAKTFALDEEITLKDWGNAVVRNIEADSQGLVKILQRELHPEGEVKKTDKKITWGSNRPGPDTFQASKLRPSHHQG